MSIAFLIVRLILGLGLAAHGSQKLFGWFGGGGVAGTGKLLREPGLSPRSAFALMAGLGETVGGLLTLLGLGGALGPVLIVLVMLVAIATVHIGKGFFNSNGGWELPASNIAAALALAFAGTGQLLARCRAGFELSHNPLHIWYALGAAVIAAALNVLARRPAPSGS